MEGFSVPISQETYILSASCQTSQTQWEKKNPNHVIIFLSNLAKFREVQVGCECINKWPIFLVDIILPNQATVGNIDNFWLVTNPDFFFIFGPQKVDFLEFLSPFLVIF